MPGLARQAAHLLDTLGIPSADVLGVSLGGGVAQELALRNRQRVGRLVLAATMCGLGGVPGNPLALSLLATPLRYYSPAFLRLTAGLVYGRGTRDELTQEQVTARASRPPSLWGYLGQLVAAAGWTSRPWLHRLRAPTLVLTGDRDPIVPSVNARILASAIPDSRVEVVPGGHLFLLEHTARCALLITKFLHEGHAS